MNERDELAKVIVAAYGEDAEAECPCEQDLDVAEAILAAGYRKPRQVTTVEELDALPNESLIRTRFGQVWEAAKLTDGENLWRTLGPAKVLRSEDLARWSLPATVLHVGGAE